jgi:hypothetical protein
MDGYMSSASPLPPVTEDYLHAAYALMGFSGLTYGQAMAHPIRRRVIEVCATSLRTKEYARSHARTVVPVRRIKLGADGHPIGWCTQLTQGPFDRQPDLIGS